MKHRVEATITITFDTEVDTDDFEEFTEEGTDLDPTDKDHVHDVMVDVYNDEDQLLEVLNENGFSVGRVDITVEPKKEEKKK
jgi:hypothetical protein